MVRCTLSLNLKLHTIMKWLIKKMDGDRRKGKGRRVCLGDKMYSIPCPAICFASVDLKEKVDLPCRGLTTLVQ